MDSAPFREFACLLSSGSSLAGPGQTVDLAFDGDSPWLKACECAVANLQGVRLDNSPDIVITDSSASSVVLHPQRPQTEPHAHDLPRGMLVAVLRPDRFSSSKRTERRIWISTVCESISTLRVSELNRTGVRIGQEKISVELAIDVNDTKIAA